MSNETKINKNSYSARTLSTFNLISSYIVDIYYNHLYIEAKKARDEGKTTSISDGYRMCCLLFAKSLDDKSPKFRRKQYYKIIEGIKEYFTLYTSMSTLTVSECIHKIVNELVPDKYLNDLTNDKKSIIVHNCLVDAIMEFTKIALCDYIDNIIENHGEQANIEALKDKMIDILLLEREKSMQMFLTGTKQPMVDRGLAVKLQNDLKTLNVQNKDLYTKLTHANQQNEILVAEFNKLMEKTKNAYRRYNTLKAEYDALKDKLSIIERKEEDYKAIDKESDTYSEVEEEPIDPMQEFLNKAKDKFIKNNRHKYGGNTEQDLPYNNSVSHINSGSHINSDSHSSSYINSDSHINTDNTTNNHKVNQTSDQYRTDNTSDNNQSNTDTNDNTEITLETSLVESTEKKTNEKKKEPKKRKQDPKPEETVEPKNNLIEDRFKPVSKPTLKRKLGTNPSISDIYA